MATSLEDNRYDSKGGEEDNEDDEEDEVEVVETGMVVVVVEVEAEFESEVEADFKSEEVEEKREGEVEAKKEVIVNGYSEDTVGSTLCSMSLSSRRVKVSTSFSRRLSSRVSTSERDAEGEGVVRTKR